MPRLCASKFSTLNSTKASNNPTPPAWIRTHLTPFATIFWSNTCPQSKWWAPIASKPARTRRGTSDTIASRNLNLKFIAHCAMKSSSWAALVSTNSTAICPSSVCFGKGLPNTPAHGARAIFSVAVQSPLRSRRFGASAYAELCRKSLADPRYRTRPRMEYDCPLNCLSEERPKIPKLLRAYLSIGAKICGPPALDRQFKTIDFLTMLDLETLPEITRRRFMN